MIRIKKMYFMCFYDEKYENLNESFRRPNANDRGKVYLEYSCVIDFRRFQAICVDGPGPVRMADVGIEKAMLDCEILKLFVQENTR